MARAHPAVLVLEAAGAVLDAITSYIDLRAARAHRDRLQTVIPIEAERLERLRVALTEEIQVAQRALEQRRRARQAIAEVVRLCSAACTEAMREWAELRTANLPELDAFEIGVERLEDAWAALRISLAAQVSAGESE